MNPNVRQTLRIARADLGDQFGSALASAANAGYAGGANFNMTDPATGIVYPFFIVFDDESVTPLPAAFSQVAPSYL